MANITYRVEQVDLSTEREDEKYEIGTRYVVFTRVDAPVYVRIDKPTAPLIRIDSKGDVLSCGEGTLIDLLYVTNGAGQGTLEYVVTDSLRLGFNTPDVPSMEPRVRYQVIPGNFSASAIHSTDLVHGFTDIIVPSLTSGANGKYSTETFYDSYRLGNLWRSWLDDTSTAAQYVRHVLKGDDATGRKIMVPVELFLNGGVTKNLEGIGWFETEMDVFVDFSGGTETSFRFGFGSAQGIFVGGGNDAFVGFAAGQATGTRLPATGLGISTSDQMACAIIGDDGAGTRTVLASTVVDNVVGGYHRLRVRIGETGGTPAVEWYIDGALVASHYGYLSSGTFRQPGTTSGQMEPMITVGMDAIGVNFDLRFGYGSGWLFKQYPNA